jgi:hypothetical protein
MLRNTIRKTWLTGEEPTDIGLLNSLQCAKKVQNMFGKD